MVRVVYIWVVSEVVIIQSWLLFFRRIEREGEIWEEEGGEERERERERERRERKLFILQ